MREVRAVSGHATAAPLLYALCWWTRDLAEGRRIDAGSICEVDR
jgi:hypothetical protein